MTTCEPTIDALYLSISAGQTQPIVVASKHLAFNFTYIHVSRLIHEALGCNIELDVKFIPVNILFPLDKHQLSLSFQRLLCVCFASQFVSSFGSGATCILNRQFRSICDIFIIEIRLHLDRKRGTSVRSPATCWLRTSNSPQASSKSEKNRQIHNPATV
jgi:hypothetical protein